MVEEVRGKTPEGAELLVIGGDIFSQALQRKEPIG